MRTPVKHSEFLRGGFQGPKIAKRGNFERVACDEGTAQTAQFWAMGSFRGLVDIQECAFVQVLVADVRFGRYKPPKKPHFGDRFNVTSKWAARPLTAYIAVSPQIYCNLPSYRLEESILVLHSL